MRSSIYRRRATCLAVLEPLESRIAPASVVLTNGAGPFTLEVDTADSHLHIKNGLGTEIYDQGQATGDDLTITGGTSTDIFNIEQTAAGMVSFTGTLSINIPGSIHLNGAVFSQTALSLTSQADISALATVSGGTVSLQANNGISLGSGISATGSLNLNADLDGNHVGTFTTTGAAVTAGAGALVIRANAISLGSMLNATNGNIQLTADSMDFTADLNAGGGTITLAPESLLYQVSLGTDLATKLSLTDTELDHLNAGTVTIGDANTGAIEINDVLSPQFARNLNLLQPASLTASGGFIASIFSAVDYQKITDNASVTVDPAASLSVSAFGGFVPKQSDSFTIIHLTSNSNIVGTFSGNPESTQIPVGGVNKTLTYVGNGGHDLVLAANPSLSASFTGGELFLSDVGGGDNHVTVANDGAGHFVFTAADDLFTNPGNGATLANGGHTLLVPTTAISTGASFNLGTGNDTVTLDFTGGNAIPSGGIVFDGGSSFDTLEILGGIQGAVTHTYASAQGGTVFLSAYGTINYTGLETIHHGGSASSFTFILPGGASSFALLGDDGAVGNGFSRLSESGQGFVTTDFQDPSGSVTIKPGSTNDGFFVTPLPDFDAGLTIGEAANPFIALTFGGSFSLASGKSLVAFAAGPVAVMSGVTLSLSGDGSAALSSTANISVDSGAAITTVHGDLNLTATATAGGNFSGISIGGTLSTSGTGSIFLNGTGGNTGTNNHGLDLHGTLTTTGTGSITLLGFGGNADSLNHGISAVGGSIFSQTGLTKFVAIAGGDTGPITSLGLDFGSAVISPGGVVLETDRGLTFENGASINASGGFVALQPHTAGTLIDLGTYQATAFGISDAMIDTIVAGQVVIGNPAAGSISLTADISSGNSLSLQTNGTLTGSGALSLDVGKTLVTLSHDVNLTGPLTVYGQATFSGLNGDFDLTLLNSANDFDAVAVHGGHLVQLHDLNGFQLGTSEVSLRLSLDTDGTIMQTGALTGGAMLLKSGVGALFLGFNNTISETTISNGLVLFTDPGAFGTGKIYLGDSNTGNNPVALFNIGNSVDLANNIVVPALVGSSVPTIGTDSSGSGLSGFSGNLTLDRPTQLVGGTPLAFISGNISGNVGTISIAGGFSLKLSGTNTFSGNLQIAGNTTLELGGAGDVIPDSSNVFVDFGSKLALGGSTGLETIGSLTGTGQVVAFNREQTLAIGAGDATFQFDGDLVNGTNALGLLKVGAGKATLTGVLAYSGSTVIAAGTLALSNPDLDNPFVYSSIIDLRAGATLDVTGLTPGDDPQTLVLHPMQKLLGSGTLEGNLAGPGAVEPGSTTSPGILTIHGSFTPAGQVLFKLNMPYATAGADYDQIVVRDGVNLSNATLAFEGGTLPTSAGQSLTLLSNTSAGASVAGVSPAEGGTVFVGNSALSVAYNSGDGNDLVLTTAIGQISLTSTLTAGKLTVSNTDASGRSQQLSIFVSLGSLIINDVLDTFSAAPVGGTLVNNNHGISIPLSKITKGVVINGGFGDDTLFVDLTTGSKLPAGGLAFNGGAQTSAVGDQLKLIGGNQGAVTYAYSNATDGSVVMSALGTVSGTGVESVVNTGTATSVIFNLPATTNNAFLQDDGTVGNGLVRLVGSTFAQTDFTLASGSLALNRGSATDSLAVGDLSDLGATALTLGTPAKPFGNISFNNSISVTGALNVAAGHFSLFSGLAVSAGSGTLTLGSGEIDGSLQGGLGLTKVAGGDSLYLSGVNTYTGETSLLSGPLVVQHSLALQNSTVRIGSSYALQFAAGLSTFTLGGLAGSGALPLTDNDSGAVQLLVGTNDSTYTGALSGSGTLDKVGNGTLTLTGINTHANTLIESGILQFGSDKALGADGSNLTFHGGTLHAIANVTTARSVVLEGGSGTFEASAGKTLTLSGVISGSGAFLIGHVGNVLVTGQSNSNTGTIELVPNGSQTINGVTVTAPGNQGNIMVTPGAMPNEVASIDLTSVNVPVAITIKNPKTGTVTVDQIISSDNTAVKSITLGTNVILGNGVADNTPDLVINGKLTTLITSDIAANTIIQLGQGLSALDASKNKPNVTIRNIMGDGVVLDAGGNGVTGGSGLGKVIINSWSGAGTIKSAQSIASISVAHGDFTGTLQVGSGQAVHGLRMAEFSAAAAPAVTTTANVGSISIPNGQWAGTGMQIDGVVAKLLTAGVAQGTSLSAGGFGTVAIKGNYSGTILSNYDPSITTTVKGKTTVTATGIIGNITIAGDFTGAINADGKVGNVTLSGTARFQGSLRGAAIGNISASSFSGSGAQTITAIGSIGNITAKSGGLSGYLIAAGTELGHDGLRDGVDESYATYFLGAKNARTAVSIGAVAIAGAVSGTTIVAGVNPGQDGIYGNDDDSIAAPPAGFTGKTKIGALSFEAAAAPQDGFSTTMPDGAASNAFEAQTLTSLKFGTGKNVATNPLFAKTFTAPTFIDTGASWIIVRVLTALV